MARTLTELFQATTGILSSLTGLVLALRAQGEGVEALLKELGLSSEVWLAPVLAIVLLLVGFSLLRQGLSRKSRLLWPEGLLIDPDNPDHLRGRTDDIRHLLEAVTNHPLVFLEGESGSGKSALVRSGLIPTLLNPPSESSALSILPIYLNSYTGDWEGGLRERLVDAVWQWLGVERRERLAIIDRNALRSQLLPAKISPLLKRIRQELGLIPLVIFDQFDDYIVADRQHFLRAGRWITAAELTGVNLVWNRIGEALQHSLLHLLFITRRDLFAGLDAVRLETPETHALDRVEPTFFTALLEQLVDPDANGRQVISNPTAGWESLKNRLIRDLSSQGRVLPIQARVVIKGLTKLSHLSVGSYERRGGLKGLEAAYIEDASGAAARASGLPAASILALLLALVDESDPNLPKAYSVAADDFVVKCEGNSEQLGRTLSVLEQEGVVRKVAVDGSEARDVWSLYHDYLAHAVLSASRRANRWQHLLKERLRALNEAGNWGSRWRALLSPWEQLRLIPPTLTGKVRWRGYGSFALMSTARLLPKLAALGIVLIGANQAMDWQAREEADRILTGIRSGIGNSVPEEELYRQLWTLAVAGPRLKKAFVERSIADIDSHNPLLHHLGPVVQSLLGLDSDGRLRIESLDLVLTHRPLTPYSAGLAVLIHRALPNPEPGLTVLIAESVVNLMQTTANLGLLASLGSALGVMGERLPVKQAKAGALRLVEVMGTTTDGREIHKLASTLGSLGERLPVEQAKAGALRLVEVMGTITDGWQLRELVSDFGSLGEQLPPEQTKTVALRLVEVMGTTTDEQQLSALGLALGGLTEQLPPEQAESGALRLLEVMGTTKDPRQFYSLRSVLGDLSERLPPEQAEAVGLRLVELMGTTTDGWYLNEFGSALGDLGERLPSEQAEAGVRRLLEVMGTTTDWEQLRELGSILGDLGERLLPKQAEAVGLRLVELMGTTTNADYLYEIVWTLVRLGKRLPPEQTEAVGLRLVELMGTTTDGGQLRELGLALGGLGERLLPEQAKAGAMRLVEAMGTTTDGEKLSELGLILVRLGKWLPPEQTKAVTMRLVEVMGTTTDEEQLRELGLALGGLGERLLPEQAKAVALRLVELMGNAMNGWSPDKLGSDLGGLAEQLPPEQAKAVALNLVDVMSTATNGWQLRALGSALGGLSEQLLPEQDEAVALRLVELMGTTTDRWRLDGLGLALGGLKKQLPSEQAKAVALRLVELMGTATNDWRLDELELTLGGLSERLSPEHAKAVALHLVELMDTATNGWHLSALGSTLGGLGERLPPEQAKAGALRLVDVMGDTTDSGVFVALANPWTRYRCRRIPPSWTVPQTCSSLPWPTATPAHTYCATTAVSPGCPQPVIRIHG